MFHTNFRNRIKQLLSFADIKIGGNRPWDIQVHNKNLYQRLTAEGSLGLGKSYIDGWWDCDKPDMFFDRILRAELDKRVKPRTDFLYVLKSKLLNLQKPSRAFSDRETTLRYWQ